MGTSPAPDPDPDALKWARERRGLSQTDVARLLGVPAADRNQVARWEHGAHTPQLHYQRRLWALFPELAPDGEADMERRAFLGLFGAEEEIAVGISEGERGRGATVAPGATPDQRLVKPICLSRVPEALIARYALQRLDPIYVVGTSVEVN